MHKVWRSITLILFSGSLLTACVSSSDDDPINPKNSGKDGDYTVSGTITGNTGEVILSLNFANQTFSGPTFVFSNKLEQDDLYGVLFVSAEHNQICTVSNAAGVAKANVTNIAVVCSKAGDELDILDRSVLGGVRTGDFNGDGAADLAIPLRTIGCDTIVDNNYFVRFLFGDGNGNFTASVEKETESTTFYQSESGIIALDFNKDGYDDFLQIHLENPQLFTGKAGNNVDLAFTYVPPGPSIYNLGAAKPLDIDKDGYKDLIGFVTHGSVQALFAYQLNNRDGTFGETQTVEVNGQLPVPSSLHNFVIGDFNQDGEQDILAYSSEILAKTPHLVLFTGNAPGEFDIPIQSTALSLDLVSDSDIFADVSKDLVSSDFNGDGYLDVALTSNTTFLQIMLNDGMGNFTAGQRVTVGSQPVKVAAYDFDNDGHLDLVSSNNKSETLHLSFGVGDGSFGDKNSASTRWKEFQMKGGDFHDMEVADFDGDGYLDVAVAEIESRNTHGGNCSAGSIQVMYSPGKE